MLLVVCVIGCAVSCIKADGHLSTPTNLTVRIPFTSFHHYLVQRTIISLSNNIGQKSHLFRIHIKLSSWRATVLQFSSNTPARTFLALLDQLGQLCLIRVVAKLCRSVALQELSLICYGTLDMLLLLKQRVQMMTNAYLIFLSYFSY